MQKVLVIGASRGIGLELVRQYREAGARVIACVRRSASLPAIEALGAQGHVLDVADPASVSALAWLLDGTALDVAIYAAGLWDGVDARTPPTQPQFDAVMHVNVLGAMQALAQIAPEIRPGGVFAALSSEMSLLRSLDDGSAWLYRTSKAALNMAMATAQRSWAEIHVVSLDPGWVRTDMGGASAPLAVDESVRGLRAAIASVGEADRGRLIHHDGRRAPDW